MTSNHDAGIGLRVIAGMVCAMALAVAGSAPVLIPEPSMRTVGATAAAPAGCTAQPPPRTVYKPVRGFVRDHGRFTTVKPPGACTGKAFGINNRGRFVGAYRVGGYLVGEGSIRSYLWHKGRLTGIDLPGGDRPGAEAAVGDINDRGQIVGSYLDVTTGTNHGFLRDTNGKITPIDHPDADGTSPVGSGTIANQITNRGEIVGTYAAAGTIHGYVRDREGRFTTIDRPGAAATALIGMNDRRQIVGASSDLGPEDVFVAPRSFLLDRGAYRAIAVPGAAANGVQSINNRGEIVGSYADAGGTFHGFLRGRTGRYTTIDHPDAMTSTNVGDINDRGQITGIVEFQAGSPSARRQNELRTRQRPILLPGFERLG